MPTMSRGQAVATLAIVMLLAGAWRWWTADERAIRAQLTSIAGALSVDPAAGDLALVTRIATLRNALAPDVRILAGPPSSTLDREPQPIVGRDTVLAFAGRWTPASGMVTVEFVDLEIVIAPQGREAEVSGAARVTAHQGSDRPAVDVVPLRATLANIDGRWLVTFAAREVVLRR
jgi:hypothetical protein